MNKRTVVLAQSFKIQSFGERAESLVRGEQARQSRLREVAFLLKETTEEERGFLHKRRRNHDSVSYVVQSHLREIQAKPREYHNMVHQ